MKKSILEDVSIDEMMRMRESGMSNAEIARAIGAGYSTVCRYLGANPVRGGRVASKIEVPPVIRRDRNMPDVENAPEGVLPVVNRVICLRGELGEYEVDTKSMRVTFTVGEAVVQIDFDKWETFAKETAAIARNVGKRGLSPEIW